MGPAFKLREPLTWEQPASKLELIDPQLGRVKVCVWRSLHFRLAAKQPLLVVRIERMEAAHTLRDPGVLWLGWHGAEPPPLATWWKDYLRRFAVDHWHRFAKQDLYWTLPHLATPARAQCWSDLMPVVVPTTYAHLAALAGPELRQRRSLALAEAPSAWRQDTRTGPPGHGRTFGCDWHTC